MEEQDKRPVGVTGFREKLELLRRFREAKSSSSKFYRGINMPDRVEMRIEDAWYSFLLTGGETHALMAEFPSCDSVQDILLKK